MRQIFLFQELLEKSNLVKNITEAEAATGVVL